MKFTYSQRKMVKLFANSGYPDQTPRSAASDLGLHCEPVTLLRVYNGLNWLSLRDGCVFFIPPSPLPFFSFDKITLKIQSYVTVLILCFFRFVRQIGAYCSQGSFILESMFRHSSRVAGVNHLTTLHLCSLYFLVFCFLFLLSSGSFRGNLYEVR